MLEKFYKLHERMKMSASFMFWERQLWNLRMGFRHCFYSLQTTHIRFTKWFVPNPKSPMIGYYQPFLNNIWAIAHDPCSLKFTFEICWKFNENFRLGFWLWKLRNYRIKTGFSIIDICNETDKRKEILNLTEALWYLC